MQTEKRANVFRNKKKKTLIVGRYREELQMRLCRGKRHKNISSHRYVCERSIVFLCHLLASIHRARNHQRPRKTSPSPRRSSPGLGLSTYRAPAGTIDPKTIDSPPRPEFRPPRKSEPETKKRYDDD